MDYFCVWQKQMDSKKVGCYSPEKRNNGPRNNEHSLCEKTLEDVRYKGVYGNNHIFSIPGCANFKLRKGYHEKLADKFLPLRYPHE